MTSAQKHFSFPGFVPSGAMISRINAFLHLALVFIELFPVVSLGRQGRLSVYHYSHFTDEENWAPRSRVSHPGSYFQFYALLSTGCCLPGFCLLISWSLKNVFEKGKRKQTNVPYLLKIYCHPPTNTLHTGQNGRDIPDFLTFPPNLAEFKEIC